MPLSNITNIIIPISEETTGEEVQDYFAKNPSLRAIPIKNTKNKIIGIIERTPFLSKLSSVFGRDLYSKRPIKQLINCNFLRLDINDTIQLSALKLTEIENFGSPCCALVFEGANFHGIIDIDDIYKKLAEEAVNKANALQITKESLQNALETKSRFLATVSHEIRTPLNGIIGMAQALLKHGDSQSKFMSQTILASGQILRRVVDDLLDMSKIENGKFDFAFSSVNCLKILKDVHQTYKENAKEKGIELILNIDESVNINFKTDEIRLKQAILNIVSNAIKFTQDGSVTINAFIKDNMLEISIIDTGIGISDNFQSKIFDAFEQEDNSNSRGFGGAGLGLSITKSIINNLGGNIILDSKIGIGTKFTVLLPVDISKEENAYENKVHIDEIDKETIKILAAEDNITNQIVLKTLLCEFPIEIIFANNGKEALELWKTMPFDLILMDLQMPIMDGITAVKKIRDIERTYQLPSIPILALSANAMEIHREETMRTGFNGHIAKPIIIEELVEAIINSQNNYEPQKEYLCVNS